MGLIAIPASFFAPTFTDFSSDSDPPFHNSIGTTPFSPSHIPNNLTTNRNPKHMYALVRDEQANTVCLKKVAQPRIQHHDDVIIRVAYAGLCRTDIFAADGRLQAGKADGTPLILGHEFSGIVVALGQEASKSVHRGQWVTAIPRLPCGLCMGCMTLQREQKSPTAYDCYSPHIVGVDYDGAFAEYIRIPAAAIVAIPMPETYTTDFVKINEVHLDVWAHILRLAAYTEPVAASLAAALPTLKKDAKGLVVGGGRIAHLTAILLQASGFTNVEWQASLEPLLQINPNTYDFIVETGANTRMMQQLVRLTRPRGTIVLKSRLTEPVGLVLADVVPKNLTIQCAAYGDFDEAVRLLLGIDKNGQKVAPLDVAVLLGECVSLFEYRRIFDEAQKQECAKIFFCPWLQTDTQ